LGAATAAGSGRGRACGSPAASQHAQRMSSGRGHSGAYLRADFIAIAPRTSQFLAGHRTSDQDLLHLSVAWLPCRDRSNVAVTAAARGGLLRAGARSLPERWGMQQPAALPPAYAVALCALLLLSYSGPASSEAVPQELYDCINEGQGLQRTVYEQFVEGYPTRCACCSPSPPQCALRPDRMQPHPHSRGHRGPARRHPRTPGHGRRRPQWPVAWLWHPAGRAPDPAGLALDADAAGRALVDHQLPAPRNSHPHRRRPTHRRPLALQAAPAPRLVVQQTTECGPHSGHRPDAHPPGAAGGAVSHLEGSPVGCRVPGHARWQPRPAQPPQPGVAAVRDQPRPRDV